MRGVVLLLLLFVVAPAGCRRDASSDVDKTPPTDSGVKPLAAERLGREDIDATDRNFAAALTGHREDRFLDDLDEVKKRGVIRVITRNNSTSFFLHRGTELGFHLELAKLFADELGVRLELVVPRANRDVIPWLLEGRGDIIIAGTPTDAPRADRVALTRPYLKTSLVVVVKATSASQVTSIRDLGERSVLIRPSSSAMHRLRSLGQETGVNLNIVASKETNEPEDLLDRVSSGKVDAAVVERRTADVELRYRDDLAVAFEIPGAEVESAFMTRKESTALHAAADDFLRRTYRGTIFNILYKRYHDETRRAADARDTEFRGEKDGALTPWDAQFHAAAKDAGVDWRLLVSQAFQESRLDPNARSQFGATGLMQLMPATAKEVGVDDLTSPEESIKGGARYMAKLLKRYEDPNIELKDQVRLALAAYNVGPMHVRDARKLADQKGLDRNRWFQHVEKALLLLSKPRYYRKAEFGYCRGEEPVRYVSEIQTRYDHYVTLTDPPPAQDTPGPTTKDPP